jgi:hypothetical protein
MSDELKEQKANDDKATKTLSGTVGKNYSADFAGETGESANLGGRSGRFISRTSRG